jgi:hypothetical protein
MELSQKNNGMITKQQPGRSNNSPPVMEVTTTLKPVDPFNIGINKLDFMIFHRILT